MTNTDSLKIEIAQKTDLNELVILENKCFDQEGFSKRQFNYLIIKAKSEFIILRSKHNLIAYLVILKRKNGKRYRIYSVAVAPEFRGMGLAHKLLSYVEGLARSSNIKALSLEVNVNNGPALNSYLKFGFTVKKEKHNYYKDGSNAYLMVKRVF